MAKNCQINIWNELEWDLDEEMLSKALVLAQRHSHWANVIEIYPQERVPQDAPAWKSPGWLEWIVNMRSEDGRKLTVGILQRTIGAEFECHS